MAWAGTLAAQTDMRGHWTATVDSPAGPVAFEIDLDKTAAGWIGSVSIPAQGATGLPLDNIRFADGKGAFHFKGTPGESTFSGALSADGKTLDGTFTPGQQSIPLKLSRTGEAKVEVPKPSPPVTAEFIGTWEGTVNVGVALHVRMTISNSKDGAEVSLVSIDQGGAVIPVSTVTQAGKKLALDIKAAGAQYAGELNAQGTEIKGTFTQVGNSTDLVFTKAAPGK
jgi:hypothetical protein